MNKVIKNLKYKTKGLLKGIIDFIFSHTKKGAEFYLTKGRELLENNENTEARNIFEKGLKYYPSNFNLNMELAKLATDQKNWKYVIKLWNDFFDFEETQTPSHAYINLANAYKNFKYYDQADQILKKGLKKYPDNRKLYSDFANIAVLKCDWYVAIKRLEGFINKFKDDTPYNAQIKLSMIHQNIGKHQKAKVNFHQVLLEYQEQISKDKKGYRKIILFDNGESRIEFYKKLDENISKVMLTFDSVYMEWKNPPFGFNLLKKQDVDIIAVRKRKRNAYQQDLSYHNYFDTVNVLLTGYTERIAYGFSLGAYAALYYAYCLDCKILALSPRLPIHPKYGQKNLIEKFDFKHNLTLPYNPNATPIIVYDPKNNRDNTYVQQEVLSYFPNAKLVKVPYGGHGIAPHLLKMGLLKKFILTVIEGGEVPKYDRKFKGRSPIYYRSLGSTCLKHNKPNWALNLAEKSLELSPLDKLAIKLKVNVLKELERHDNAIEYLAQIIDQEPKNLAIRMLLIDLYLDMGDLNGAEEELVKVKKKFGNSAAVGKKEKKILVEKKRVMNLH